MDGFTPKLKDARVNPAVIRDVLVKKLVFIVKSWVVYSLSVRDPEIGRFP